MRNWVVRTFILGFVILSGRGAWAIVIPANAVPQLDPSWNELSIRVDIHNLVGPDNAGLLPDAGITPPLEAANLIWSQCAVHFVPRVASNVRTQELKVPYEPKSQDDLGKISVALNPNGFTDAIPLTYAGPWNFFDPSSGVYLHGLGWVFTNGSKVSRIGAMVSATLLAQPSTGAIIAHELAHALSLPHVGDPKNLMGPGGGPSMTMEQCVQARNFTKSNLADFTIGSSSAPLAHR